MGGFAPKLIPGRWVSRGSALRLLTQAGSLASENHIHPPSVFSPPFPSAPSLFSVCFAIHLPSFPFVKLEPCLRTRLPPPPHQCHLHHYEIRTLFIRVLGALCPLIWFNYLVFGIWWSSGGNNTSESSLTLLQELNFKLLSSLNKSGSPEWGWGRVAPLPLQILITGSVF